jgi:hypothetical protein
VKGRKTMSVDLPLVFSNAVEGQDAALNTWFDNQHLGVRRSYGARQQAG